MKMRVVLTACLALMACSGGSPGLSRMTEVSSSTKCPQGGVTLAVGVDKNGNGVLDDAEVTQTTEICNGAVGATGAAGAAGAAGVAGTTGPTGAAGSNGAPSLVSTTMLNAGDAHCANGGVKLSTGLDNGAGGGIAGNGVLEAGEVTATQYVCNGTAPLYSQSTDAPTGPAGTSVIDVSGVDSDGGSAGGGGRVNIAIQTATQGGHVLIFTTGAVDAGFAPSAAPTFRPGSTPLVVSSDLTIGSFATAADALDAGATYFYSQTAEQYVALSDAGTTSAWTSVQVAAGKVLTLPAVGLRVPLDIVNAGTIVLPAGSNLGLSAERFYGAAGSLLATRGADSTDGGAGAPGGTVRISASLLINHGAIDARGGAGDQGGAGGALYLGANDGVLENTGALTTTGGAGLVQGGNGGQINLNGSLGARNAGALDASGGAGPQRGGAAAPVGLSAAGLVLNSGALTARGGACSTSGCVPGRGSNANVEAWGADVRTSGSIDTSGGAAVDSPAGVPGAINLSAGDAEGWNVNSIPAGSVYVSGSLVARGSAFKSNAVNIWESTNYPRGQQIVLYGYQALLANGGAAPHGQAGWAGSLTVSNGSNLAFSGFGNTSGSIVNQARLVAHGGDGVHGGAGGGVNLSTQSTDPTLSHLQVVRNSGSVDLSAGASSTTGACQSPGLGRLYFEGTEGVANTGEVTINGGACSAGTGQSGSGGAVNFWAEFGDATNSAAVHVNGGSSHDQGGLGGSIFLRGVTAQSTAALEARGGNATAAGGQGGTVTLYSTGGASTSSGTVSVAGGTGTPAGLAGAFVKDGLTQP